LRGAGNLTLRRHFGSRVQAVDLIKFSADLLSSRHDFVTDLEIEPELRRRVDELVSFATIPC
jgi:hypothetical protein